MSYQVEFRKINRHGSREPVIHASVDGFKIMWDPARGGWTCHYEGCDDIETCPHVDAVEALLWPGVLKGWNPQ